MKIWESIWKETLVIRELIVDTQIISCTLVTYHLVTTICGTCSLEANIDFWLRGEITRFSVAVIIDIAITSLPFIDNWSVRGVRPPIEPCIRPMVYVTGDVFGLITSSQIRTW